MVASKGKSTLFLQWTLKSLCLAATLCFAFPARTSNAQDRYFDAEGVRIHYVVEGAGEPIVLVHGIQGSVETWASRGIISNLARDYQVIAFDLRGHGKSEKPHDVKAYGREMGLDVVRLLDHLGIKRAHVVGYSLGSHITSQLLTLRPARFITATLVAASGRIDWDERQAREAYVQAAEREHDCISRTLIRKLAPPNAPPPSEDRYKELAAACFADTAQDRFALAALTRSFGDQAIDPVAAAAVKVPTLAVVGSNDPLRTGLEKLKGLRPDVTLVVIPGATHGGPEGVLGKPEFMLALRSFLAAHRSAQ